MAKKDKEKVDRALRSRQVLRYIAQHLSGAVPQQVAINDAGMAYLSAAAASTAEAPGEERWPPSWTPAPGRRSTFNQWAGQYLKIWRREWEVEHGKFSRAKSREMSAVLAGGGAVRTGMAAAAAGSATAGEGGLSPVQEYPEDDLSAVREVLPQDDAAPNTGPPGHVDATVATDAMDRSDVPFGAPAPTLEAEDDSIDHLVTEMPLTGAIAWGLDYLKPGFTPSLPATQSDTDSDISLGEEDALLGKEKPRVASLGPTTKMAGKGLSSGWGGPTSAVKQPSIAPSLVPTHQKHRPEPINIQYRSSSTPATKQPSGPHSQQTATQPIRSILEEDFAPYPNLPQPLSPCPPPPPVPAPQQRPRRETTQSQAPAPPPEPAPAQHHQPTTHQQIAKKAPVPAPTPSLPIRPSPPTQEKPTTTAVVPEVVPEPAPSPLTSENLAAMDDAEMREWYRWWLGKHRAREVGREG